MSETLFPLPDDYNAFLSDLKERIRNARVRAVLTVNRELILLYWQIGREILARQEQHGWSRDILVMQIETNLYQRQGGAVNNFDRTLPQPESDLARQMLKDP